MPKFEELVESFQSGAAMECTQVTLGRGRLFVTYVILCFSCRCLKHDFSGTKVIAS